jgi:hypothetical protein
MYLSTGRFIESTDTVGNELLPISILEYGSLSFDQYYAPPGVDGAYPTGDEALVRGLVPERVAYRLSPDLPTKSIPWWFVRVGGHVVSLYPIVPGLLNTPVFFVANLLHVELQDNAAHLTQISTSVIGALSVLAMYACLVQICRRRRTVVFLVIAFAFGTAVWSANSRSLYQHGAALLFIAFGLAALMTRRPRLVALAGLLLGLAVLTRPTNIIIVATLGVYVLRHERRAFVGFAALAVIPGLLLAAHSWLYWGTPLALGQSQGLAGFTAPEPAMAAVGLLLNPNRGLLVFSPFFVFSVAYAIYVVRHRAGPPLLHYVIWSCFALIGLYTLWHDWAGGHTYGYRFLIELVPGLMLLLAACWTHVIEPRPFLRALFLTAMVVSIYVHGVGAIAYPCGFDSEPNDIDVHHERLWDIASGEIARCTERQLNAWQTALARLG